MSKTRNTWNRGRAEGSAIGYVPPDPVAVDAIYSFEDGGINPVHDSTSRWPVNGSAKNCVERYREAKMRRSCYQGFWGDRDGRSLL